MWLNVHSWMKLKPTAPSTLCTLCTILLCWNIIWPEWYSVKHKNWEYAPCEHRISCINEGLKGALHGLNNRASDIRYPEFVVSTPRQQKQNCK